MAPVNADGYLRYIKVEAMAFQPGGHILGLLVNTVPIQKGNLIMLDSSTGNILYQRIGDNVASMSFNADGSVLALWTETGYIMLLQRFNNQVLCQIAGHDGPISDLVFSPDGMILASESGIEGLSEREIVLWDLETRL